MKGVMVIISYTVIPGRECCMLQLLERVYFKNLCLLVNLLIEMYYFIYLSKALDSAQVFLFNFANSGFLSDPTIPLCSAQRNSFPEQALCLWKILPLE